MTRINSAIHPKRLTDEHLLAEHREIKRLPYVLRQAIEKGSIGNIPQRFALGTGHVRFFLDKMAFILDRYRALREECVKRGFNVEDYSGNWNGLPQCYRKEYIPTTVEREMLEKRISVRLKESSKACWHYYGERITADEAVRILNDNQQ